MSELKPRITENGIDYILVGDYYIPDLKLPEEHRPIGKYGRMHREYLREAHPARLNTLTLTGELWTYLADLNEQAQERLDTIIDRKSTRLNSSHITITYAVFCLKKIISLLEITTSQT